MRAAIPTGGAPADPPVAATSATPPAAPESAPGRPIEDLIPDDVESSFGGATGDLWSDSADPLFGTAGTTDPDGYAEADMAEEAPGPRGAPEPGAQPDAPARGVPKSRRGAKTPATEHRSRQSTAAGSTRSAGAAVSTSDTVEGKAFARLQELFPGRVLEVTPLKPAAETNEQADEAVGTTEEYVAGYDDVEEPDPPGSDE